MATVNFAGIDEWLASIDELGQLPTRNITAAAMAGGNAAKAEMEKTVAVRTGGLKGHLKVDGPYRDAIKGTYVLVYPSGTKKNGRKTERYETVGFVLEHGRSNMPADPWMQNAVTQGADAIHSAIVAELAKE